MRSNNINAIQLIEYLPLIPFIKYKWMIEELIKERRQIYFSLFYIQKLFKSKTFESGFKGYFVNTKLNWESGKLLGANC